MRIKRSFVDTFLSVIYRWKARRLLVTDVQSDLESPKKQKSCGRFKWPIKNVTFLKPQISKGDIYGIKNYF